MKKLLRALRASARPSPIPYPRKQYNKKIYQKHFPAALL